MITIEELHALYDREFAASWRRTFAEFAKASEDRIWLAGPSSYLFSLAGQKFAVDLQIRREKDLLAVADTLVADTAPLSFILITHPHGDHMCPPLMQALRDTDIRWYIPADCPKKMVDKGNLKPENIIRVRDGDVIREGDLSIRVFNSCHVRPGGKPYPQCGYAIQSPAGQIVMPVDVRDYSYRDYPALGDVDLCISHVWAGDDAINPENYLPMLEQFARFSAQFAAKKYFLCHLYEIGRPEKFMWTDKHASIAADNLQKLLSRCTVEAPQLWTEYEIF
ncbi:MAG: hypothetical protein E7662_02410 [Ruminococcaceae bacterium]|nr:hypothetical protein [Oscillospiraceae bacterium]